MSIASTEQALTAALAKLPDFFRKRLIATYLKIRLSFFEGNWDTTGLRSGIFGEVLLRFLQSHLTGSYIPFGQKIPNFINECRKLEQLPQAAGSESLRIIMPRALILLYTLRNKRGIGHVGGDVDANHIDAATCLRIADWCMCELIRIFYAISLEEAQAILDAITVRQLPGIWVMEGKKRVLQSNLDYKSQVLLLLYSEHDVAVPVEDLYKWVEHPRLADFIRRVLRPLHKERLIEYDEETRTVLLSPKGVKLVEEKVKRESILTTQ